MGDIKETTDGRDRSKVSASDDYELIHVAGKFNVSVEEVKRAIQKVGNDRSKVEEYLRQNQENVI